MRKATILACTLALLGLAPQPGPMRARLTLRAVNLAVDPIDFGDPGMIGDSLRVDVEGPSLRALQGEMRFRGADGEETRLHIDASYLSANHTIELMDSSFCTPSPTDAYPVLTIVMDSGDGTPRVFVHLDCTGATSRAIFSPTTNGSAVLDKVSIDISVR